MGLIRDKKTGSNVSVASINGYTAEKVLKAEEYLKEIGGNTRAFPLDRLVEMYNDIKGTNDRVPSCRCQASKYYMGLQNYVTYGKLTLAANGIDIYSKEEPKDVAPEEEVKEDEEVEKKKLTVAERMAKAREARKKKKEDAESKD